jgi:DNA-directed RNA polymerase specialized sigma24 family protein
MMENEILQAQRETVMLLAILVKRGSVQSALIEEMGNVGFPPKRIAELLYTSPNTVSVALHHARKTGKKKTSK